MNISDLKDGLRRVDVSGVVKELGETKTVNLKTGGTAKVRDVRLEDSSGHITLTLWNDDIEKVKKESLVAVSNGYVNSFQGAIRLNVGRYGKLAVDGQ